MALLLFGGPHSSQGNWFGLRCSWLLFHLYCCTLRTFATEEQCGDAQHHPEGAAIMGPPVEQVGRAETVADEPVPKKAVAEKGKQTDFSRRFPRSFRWVRSAPFVAKAEESVTDRAKILLVELSKENEGSSLDRMRYGSTWVFGRSSLAPGILRPLHRKRTRADARLSSFILARNLSECIRFMLPLARFA
jgi:hypothetical protein